MKKISFFLLFLFSIFFLKAQPVNFEVKSLVLSNGLKVLLCEDHAKPEITGGIYVHVGSKNDPSDATGMAHYFEHIMFKGTDKIGTVDWDAEKVYLDSISCYYDKLHETNTEKARTQIQKKINELTIQSAQYAIPNEVDVILSKMGGKGINAFTGYDQTVYLNTFPSNQLEKWIDVYYERFRNPVFRLFQSELETVYEEKNMYSDNPFTSFMEGALKTAFGEHPYGRPVVGYTEHLKNPQISRLHKFFNDYYVANNMTLILVGDFDIESTIPVIKEKFAGMRVGNVPKMPSYKLPEFKGHTVVEVRQTPVKMGIIGFRTCASNSQDNVVATICSSIFSNSAGTGLIDKLYLDGKIMGAAAMEMSFLDNGSYVFMYIPKLVGQSCEEAEQYIFDCVEKVKTGDFSDDLLEAVKMRYLTENIKNTESCSNLFNLILDYEMSGRQWSDFHKDMTIVKNLTKEDIMAFAEKYFTDNCMIYRSKMGFPKKDKIDKPNWEPVIPKNVEAKSQFAADIEAIETKTISPQNIVIGRDAEIYKADNMLPLYSSKNPYNDIFNLKFYFNYGSIDNKDLQNAVDYVDMQGTANMSFDDYALALQKLGAEINISVNQENTVIEIEGLEKDFLTLLGLCFDKLYNPDNDETKLDMLVENKKASIKMMEHDAASWGEAVYEYALYGAESEYVNTPSKKEVEAYSGDYLINIFKSITKYYGFITFSGNIHNDEIVNEIRKYYSMPKDVDKGSFKVQTPATFRENTVYIVHNKKFLQSNIRFFINGNPNSFREKTLAKSFNKYFGSDMYSIVFQEIREFRSLGYSAYAYTKIDNKNRINMSLYGFLGTQSDKTLDGIEAMSELITNMPEKPQKFADAKESLINSFAAEYTDFRDIPFYVSQWKYSDNATTDPHIDMYEIIKAADFKDIVAFYKRNFYAKPLVITLSGNMKRVDKSKLSQFGKIIEVKKSDIFTE
ncbi:MAG: insulinase family protein [Bacteroidales bacterium]|jgi:zinc protease|nr:insulinase family protein [Bacteroidales bacterium]MDD2204558.1 insulinase family protein [Bacteroidales bacterium]MDD3913499.1 insulinase family protein [Bacteroidales bacterium]MDD4633988.1 insulinase family protein [Bacteroidales bacterium]